MSKALREYFEKSGKPQHELAAFCGVRQATVSRWATGKLKLSGENLQRVSQFTGIPPADLDPETARLFSIPPGQSAEAG